MQTKRIRVTGEVQGGSLCPFVSQVATRLKLCGWVASTLAGVEIELEGEPPELQAFLRALVETRPPLARIDSIDVQDVPSNGPPYSGASRCDGFEIRASVPQPDAFQPVSPDMAICPDCLQELFDPHDRRYGYPFINCAHCGPRFAITRDIPFDRALTTMRAFEMCEDCAREYHDPLDRRFHAEPLACPKCGPKVWLFEKDEGRRLKDESGRQGAEAIAEARRLLREGYIVAVKGLGGFHLACDATNDRAVERLRDRKGQVDKPFALMAWDLASVEAFCYVSDSERTVLESRARPIVLLHRLPDTAISERVAPNCNSLGVMLPCAPLHYLLLTADRDPLPAVLVMTGGSLGEGPVAKENAEAVEKLSGIADCFLLHNLDIQTRASNSVVRVFEDHEYPLRRSRGYAPFPVQLPLDTQPTLATGAELENTFCVTRDRVAFLSPHIVDLADHPAPESFEAQIEHFKRLFRIQPVIVAHDLDPRYVSTRYAQSVAANKEGIAGIAVQHHHAHVASCMAENGLPDEPVIGVAFDGAGYGTDGKIWGGEFLLARYAGFTRAAHLAYIPLPGGNAGTRRVYRSALAHLAHAGVEWSNHLPCVAIAPEQELRAIRRQLETGPDAPETSSMGQLFDAAAALIGVREVANYNAQAAVELEQWVVEDLGASYGWQWTNPKSERPIVLDPAPIIRSIAQDYARQVPPWVIATKFHNSVAELVYQVAALLREREGLNRVVLSGSVFQNVSLLTRTLALLRGAQFEIYIHRRVPPNDAGISLGQAVIANAGRA